MARPSPQTTRLVAVIDLLASRQGEGLTLSDIARRLGLSPVTCHPMLASLLQAGWLVRHPSRKTYRLGPALATIGKVAAAGFTALEVCHPVMVELQQELGLSCLALVPGDDHATIVDIVRDTRVHDAAIRIGDQVPFQPPLGSTFLAWQDAKVIRRWIGRAGDDPETVDRYQRLLAAVRRRGYAIDLDVPDGVQLRDVLSRIDEQFLDGQTPDSPLQLRAFLERFAALIPVDNEHSPVELDPDQGYRIGSISTAVFDRHGAVTLLLVLRGFPAELPGAEADGLGRRLVRGAAVITAAIGGQPPAPGDRAEALFSAR